VARALVGPSASCSLPHHSVTSPVGSPPACRVSSVSPSSGRITRSSKARCSSSVCSANVTFSSWLICRHKYPAVEFTFVFRNATSASFPRSSTIVALPKRWLLDNASNKSKVIKGLTGTCYSTPRDWVFSCCFLPLRLGLLDSCCCWPLRPVPGPSARSSLQLCFLSLLAFLQ
jgi:hypothetical protein